MAKTVLIVDDVAFVRRTLTEIFKEAHYQVVGEATNGAQAMELYVKHRPDVVTMDLVMPIMSGIDATRKICKIDKEARIVVISAMGQENLVMEAINAGARDYILKPFTAQDVLMTVEKLFANEERAAGKIAERG